MVTSRHRQRLGLQDITGQVAAYAPAQQSLAAVEGLKATKDEEQKVKMYDLIDHTWTSPLELTAVQTFHLNKVVYRCSACQWTSTWKEQFADHLKQMQSQRKMHAKADTLPSPTVNGLAYRCAGCSSAFAVPTRVQMHVDSIMRQTAGHEGAELLLARRFALEPPVTPIVNKVGVAAASQLERVVVPHKRKRRHHRGARSADGN